MCLFPHPMVWPAPPPYPLPPTFWGSRMQHWAQSMAVGLGVPLPPPDSSLPSAGEGLHQLREALKILAERVLILETMIGLYGE